jgi:hypothetical protein
MVKSSAHWEQPASDKGSAAQEQKQLKPGKSDLTTPRDMDWHYAGKQQGVGFSGNATGLVEPQSGFAYISFPIRRRFIMLRGGDNGA